MKTGIVVFFWMASVTAWTQTPVNKTYLPRPGQEISFRFDYPELVRITTWDKNEVSIQGTVSINEGENDDAFELIQTESEGSLYIENRIRDMKNLPHRMTIVDEGKKIVFRTKADYKKYAEEHGKDYQMMSWGLEMDILLEVKVPRNTMTTVKSVYGMVEVKDFSGPLTVEATYGGVDAALLETTTGELTAETNYGQIYTNLDIKFSGDGYQEKNFHSWVSAKPGKGPKYNFGSKYGNVYLRKPVN
jgi:hypothetical protein